jgi:ATP-dependent protease ClpP protease subunit
MSQQKPETTLRARPPAISIPAQKRRLVDQALRQGLAAQRTFPAGVISRIMARERPGPLPLPATKNVNAFTSPAVFDKWSNEAAGLQALERDDAVITMYDIIGEDFWSGAGVTAKKIAAQLRAIGDRPVQVHINSPGGDMFEGIAIYNTLREHPQPITVKIMGMAASAASVIAMAGDEVQIGAAAFLMIHNCWVVAAGNRHDFTETAAFLEPFDLAMAEVYAHRTGIDLKAVQKWMDAETYMSGSMAIDRGFADSLLAADAVGVDEKAKAEVRGHNDLRALELQLVAAGLTRTEARARINKIKGTPGAALEDLTPGAEDDATWVGAAAALIATIKGN